MIMARIMTRSGTNMTRKLLDPGRAGGAAGLVAAVVLMGTAAMGAEAPVLNIENQSEHPVKVALPGAPAATIASGAEPVRIEGANEDGAGVTARLWWTSDPRQLCQIYTPWERTITVTGSREILCRSR